MEKIKVSSAQQTAFDRFSQRCYSVKDSLVKTLFDDSAPDGRRHYWLEKIPDLESITEKQAAAMYFFPELVEVVYSSEERVKNTHDEKHRVYTTSRSGSIMEADAFAFMKGMEFVLNAYDIKIEGVNK